MSRLCNKGARHAMSDRAHQAIKFVCLSCSPKQFTYLLRILYNNPSNSALQGRKEVKIQ